MVSYISRILPLFSNVKMLLNTDNITGSSFLYFLWAFPVWLLSMYVLFVFNNKREDNGGYSGKLDSHNHFILFYFLSSMFLLILGFYL